MIVNAMLRCGLHVVTDEALDEARDDLAYEQEALAQLYKSPALPIARNGTDRAKPTPGSKEGQ